MDNKPPIYQRIEDFRQTLIYFFDLALRKTKGIESKQTIFHARNPVKKTISQYINRVFFFMNCSTPCYVIALVLMNRVQEKNPMFTLIHQNFHKFFITALMVATKFNDDQYYRNHYYAQVGGIKPEEFNLLEIGLLKLLDFDSHVKKDAFERVVEDLETLYETEVPKVQKKIKKAQDNPEEAKKWTAMKKDIINKPPEKVLKGKKTPLTQH